MSIDIGYVDPADYSDWVAAQDEHTRDLADIRRDEEQASLDSRGFPLRVRQPYEFFPVVGGYRVLPDGWPR